MRACCASARIIFRGEGSQRSGAQKNHKKMFPILMYHSISSNSSSQFRPFAALAEHFEEHISFIQERGYRFWTVSGLLDALKRDPEVAQTAVVITFDDGFEDFYSAALPILMRHGATATLYVVTGSVGGTSTWLLKSGEGSRRMLDWRQLTEIRDLGIEIGAHTFTHPQLDCIPASQAKEEITGSKHALEDKLGIAVRSFAYPYGFYNKPVRSLVDEAGYDSACAVRYAMSSAADDRFALSRHIVRHGAGDMQIGALLEGRPPLLPLMVDRARSRIGKFVRQAVYGVRQ